MHPGRLPGLVSSLATLLATLLATSAAGAAPRPHPPARKAAPPAPADFARLSGARAQACGAPPDPRLAALGQPSQRACAWNQHLDMQYWRALPVPGGACLPPAAIAWQRLAGTGQSSVPAWRANWNAQGLVSGAAQVQQALALWRTADGAWSAVLWRWQPADQPATRAWQQNHWNEVLQAARALNAANPAPPAAPLLQAWLDASNGKPRALDGEHWRWVADNACLDLQTTGIGQTQLHLPYSRDDARLEQRAGMQVQLARKFPDAEWLQPFTLMEPTVAGVRTGAKFFAIWKDGAALRGQLWIPLREGGILRARIDSALPSASPSSAARADADADAKARAALLERELTALAHAWEVRHD